MSSNLPSTPSRVLQVLLYMPRGELEPDALKQLVAVAESPLPAGDSFVSAMPDCHLGKGVTIGTVFASERYVCPNAVGVDIGAHIWLLASSVTYKSAYACS